MHKNFAANGPKLADYAEAAFSPEDDVLKEIRERSDRDGLPGIQVGAMDGLHLEVLTRAIGARRAIEVGTLGGYSGVCIARGLPADGKLFTLELDPHHAEVARESFKKAGVTSKTEVVIGRAIESLSRLASKGPFDLIFIDADKTSYPDYLAFAAENLRVGGVVLADNTFAWGHIGDKSFGDKEIEDAVRALRAFNEGIAHGGRFRATILPTGEGLTMGVKIK
jgi:caffeoyl-CoA O-methyltransferase